MPTLSQRKSGIERRRLPPEQDWLFRSLIAGSIVGWLLFVAAMLLFHYARPELQTGFMQALGINTEQGWHHSLTGWLLLTLVVTVLLSLVALLVRGRRSRRRNDGLWLNLMLLALLSASSLVWLLAFAG